MTTRTCLCASGGSVLYLAAHVVLIELYPRGRDVYLGTHHVSLLTPPHRSPGEIHRGEWLPTHLRGEIRFVFDNTYSRLRSKQVKFEVKRGGTDRAPELGPLSPTQLVAPSSPSKKKKGTRNGGGTYVVGRARRASEGGERGGRARRASEAPPLPPLPPQPTPTPSPPT